MVVVETASTRGRDLWGAETTPLPSRLVRDVTVGCWAGDAVLGCGGRGGREVGRARALGRKCLLRSC